MRVNTPKLLIATLCLSSPAFAEVELRGEFGIQQRYFFEDALFPEQPRSQASAFVMPEYFMEWNDGYDSLTFKPFFRFDQEDTERTHGDIRELSWLHAADTWEAQVGVGQVFWGQAESIHLVDVINQTDTVEDFDGEAKLGQPMASFTWLSEYGSVSIYALPYFRERTFSGPEGRIRTPIPIDTDNPLFESDDEERHVDFAVRLQTSLDTWEIGLSAFHGTNREPELIANVNAQGEQVLLPFYRQINQVGIDVLNVAGSWLWKFEAIYRQGQNDNPITPDMGNPLAAEEDVIDFFAAVGGIEYTFIGFMESNSDVGFLVEYLYDERDNNFFAPAQNDLMVGARWVLNDLDGTEILMGYLQDLDDTMSRGGLIEASSRMGENWRWRIDGYFFSADDPLKPLFFVRRDDFIQLGIEYFF